MAAPSYTTDLATHTDCSATTGFAEATGFTATDGAGIVDSDLAIYGSVCISEAQRKSGKGSLIYTGTARTLPTSGAFFIWYKFFAPNALLTKASGGIQMFVGSDSANFRQYYVNGSDTYPYGGWKNYAVDPRISASATTGTPGTTYASAGFGADLSVGISKGNSHTLDHIRWGRGQAKVEFGDGTSGYATFSGLATVNDNATTGRWGLFQEVGGSYLWKGLMSLGTATNAVDFRDSNVVIAIDNTEYVAAAFNRIEISNTSSNVEWNSINISSLGTVSKGQFEVVDNATVALDSCIFTDMSTFTFNAGTNPNSATTCTFRRCGLITAGGADFDSSSVLLSTVAADEGALYDNRTTTASTTLNEYDNMTFSQGTNAHHAMRFGTGVQHDITLNNIAFNGFSSVADSNGATFRFDRTTGAINLNLIGCTVDGSAATTSNIGVDDAAGITVTVVINPVTEKVNVKNTSGVNIQNARVLVETAATISGGEMFEAAVTSLTQSGGTATCDTTAVHGLVTGDKVVVRGAQPDGYNKVATVTVTDTDTFTYAVDSGLSSPATGTPVVSFVALHGLTDANGNIEATRTWGANQALKGWARKKNSVSPFYKDGDIAYDVDSSNGNTVNVVLQPDE